MTLYYFVGIENKYFEGREHSHPQNVRRVLAIFSHSVVSEGCCARQLLTISPRVGLVDVCLPSSCLSAGIVCSMAAPKETGTLRCRAPCEDVAEDRNGNGKGRRLASEVQPRADFLSRGGAGRDVGLPGWGTEQGSVPPQGVLSEATGHCSEEFLYIWGWKGRWWEAALPARQLHCSAKAL